MGNWQGSAIQILVIILMVGVPTISAIFKKVKEQAEIKAARNRQRSMEMETLRSTKVVERTSPADERSEAVDRQRAMRDLAVQRQAQLQELRQRQLEAARQRQQVKQQGQKQQGADDDRRSLTSTPQPQVRQGPTAIPSSQQGVTGVPGVPGAGQSPRPVVRAPQPVIAPTQRRRDTAARPTPQPPVAPANRERQTPQQRQASSAQSTVPTTSSKPARPDRLGVRAMLFGADGRPRSHADIQRLFALNEVLSKPVSMRTDREIGNGL